MGPVIEINKFIILEIRLPRIILASLIGALLSLAGLLTQTLFRNPIAEPYLLGISAGAALGAFISKYFLNLFPYQGQFFAFLFSQLIVLIAIFISMRDGFLPRETLLLAGIALSLLASGILSLLIFLSPSERIKIFFWLFGSFSYAQWKDVIPVTVIFMLSVWYIFFNSRKYDLMLLSDEEAITLGLNIKKERIFLAFFISIITGVSVSITGIIGFIGLMVPHISRRLTSSGIHKNMIMPCILTGAILLVLCDDFSRTLFNGAEIPVGVFTSLIGVPFFISLLFKPGSIS